MTDLEYEKIKDGILIGISVTILPISVQNEWWEIFLSKLGRVPEAQAENKKSWKYRQEKLKEKKQRNESTLQQV